MKLPWFLKDGGMVFAMLTLVLCLVGIYLTDKLKRYERKEIDHIHADAKTNTLKTWYVDGTVKKEKWK